MTLSKDDYKSAIVRIVEQLYSETNKPITGAVLAERLRTSLQASYTDVGYVKLSEPIHELVESQQLKRNRRVKHLEVAPPSFEFDLPKTQGCPSVTKGTYVREDAWPVFAMLHDRSIAVFDKQLMKFRLLADDATLRDSQIRVATPSNTDHRNWIDQFAHAEGLSLEPALTQTDGVLREFSVWMQSQDTNLQHKWKDFRAAKVADVIREWAARNGVDANDFLSPVISRYSARTTATPANKPEAEIRSAVLRCVADLSLDELDNIMLPLRVVLKHFKPRD
ncbi:hypothetical protein SH449x_002782 [Pirellulaceae bacterium SH449]